MSEAEKEVQYASRHYDVSSYRMRRIIECESQWRNIQSEVVQEDGTRERSFGIVQIHLPSHSNITKSDALDKKFSIWFLAEQLAKGKADMWHGYDWEKDICTWKNR